MVEHDVWVGKNYQSGIGGQKIAIVGHSHHRRADEADYAKFTIDTIEHVIEKDDLAFFYHIRKYFGFDRGNEFWSRVLFFNFLPDCVGTGDNRFAYGTPDQIQRGQRRALRIFGKHQPDKAIVFTTKGWHEFPPTRKEADGKDLRPLGSEFPQFSWGNYDVGGHVTMAFGLRHTQGASDDIMRRAVKAALDTPTVTGATD